MSDETEVLDAPAPPAAAKSSVPVVPLMFAVIVAVVLATGGAGGVLFWAIKSGKLPMGGVKTVTVVLPAEPIKTKLVPLDPLLVNLADPDGRSYLRIAMTLKLEDPPPDPKAKPKEEKAEKGAPKNEFEAAERDAAFSILGKETTSDLLAPDGKERLKKDLTASFKEHVPEIKVVDVLITEFLVQR